MADIKWLVLLPILFALTNGQQLQIVTPESVTDQMETRSSSNIKREASNGTLDSYLMALKESHGSSNRYDSSQPDGSYPEDTQDGEINYGPPSDSGYGPPKEENYGPPKEESYGPPKEETYGPPKGGNYGPPKGYQPMPSSYHKTPSKPSPPIMYGPPSPVPSYLPTGPTAPPSYGIPYENPGSPHGMMSGLLGGLLPKSIDLETVFKLLLKLTLFKMIVKFMGVLFLMMAWPLFQSKEKDMMMMSSSEEEEEEDDNDKRRQFESLNDLTATVWESIFPPNQKYNGTKSDGETEDEDEGEFVEKVAGAIDEKMTSPSEEAAIGFLQFWVSAANTVVGWMMSFMRRRNNEVDPIEEILGKVWANIKRKLTTTSVISDSQLR